jgi:hypothetical protein
MMKWLSGERPPKTDERVALVFAMVIVGGTGVMSIIVVVGCFFLVTRRYEIDQALLAICTGLISSILTGAGSSVQQIISHYFNRKEAKQLPPPEEPPQKQAPPK